MNILMVHPHDLFCKSEPWTIRIKNIAKKIEKKGHKIKICYFPLVINGDYRKKNIENIELIPLLRFPSPRTFIRNTVKLIKLAKWADIVHFQKCHHYAAVPAVMAAYLTGTPLHYDWDDWEEKIWFESCGKSLHSKFIGLSFRVLERWLPVLADSVSCASQNLKDLSVKFGVSKDYIFDAPVGADLESFKPGLSGQVIWNKYGLGDEIVLYIGQLHGAQYVDLFIQAANIVLHKRPNARFMVVGEGFLESSLRELVYDLGLDEKVIFTGSILHEDIPHYIAASTVCVAPFKDTQVTRCKSPLKIVEYLSSGKAVVASNVGEVRRMVGGVGLLVQPGDYHALAQKIVRLLADKGLRDRLGSIARKRIEYKYNWDYTADSILSAYKKILK